jgi:hypothetical protein
VEVEEPRGPLRDLLRQEAAALAQKIIAQAEQAERLRLLADRVEGQCSLDRQNLAQLEGVLGEASQLAIDDFDRRLRGQRLERVAIRILSESHHAAADIHYREWFELIRAEGYQVTGRNPLGTFLSQLSRSEAVERVGRRTGRYRLRLAA